MSGDGPEAAASLLGMDNLTRFLRIWGAPCAAAVFFTLWCIGEAGRMGGSFLVWPGAPTLTALTLAIGLAAVAPLASLVLAVLLAVALLVHLVGPLSSDWAIYLGVGYALFFASLNPKTRAWHGPAAALVFSGTFAFLMVSRQYGSGVGWLGVLGVARPTMFAYWLMVSGLLLVIMLLCWLPGMALRLREERGWLTGARLKAEESLRHAEIDLVVEQERNRIARDLHDVLGHSLAVIAAQADGSRYLGKDQPKPVLNALENIAVAARRALADAQRVIDGVREDSLERAPQPGLADLDTLIAQMQAGQLSIERTESGAPVELETGQQLAVYRIVQEALTNALRHGGRGTAVMIHLDWSGPGLALQIGSRGAAPESGAAGGPGVGAVSGSAASDSGEPGGQPERIGRGIPGMRERANLAGGWLTAGPDGADFRVTAFIPYSAAAVSPVVASAALPAGEPALALGRAGE